MLARLRTPLRWIVGWSERDPLGARGETAAARFLRRRRFRVLARNVRVHMGEADLLCLAPDGRTIVVVEVKTRRTAAPGERPFASPEASITAHKRQKLTAVSRHLARANHWNDRPVRVDVVGVEWPPRGKPTLRHHEGVIVVRR
jgi:putative endonuclease